MNASRRLLVGMLAALLAGGLLAAPAASQAPARPDSVAVRATALRARCAGLQGDRAMGCYNDALLALLARDGVAAAMSVLERVSELDETVKREGHMYAHSIGLAAFRGPDQVGATFAQCTPIFQSGCYHGVIQSFFTERMKSSGSATVSTEVANGLCASYRGDEGKRWLLFQCVHGMGHGLAVVYSHDLPKMLTGCDLLVDPWERQGCYGGAFMENVVQAISPHQMVGRPEAAGADEHAGMEMGGADMAGMDHAHMDHGGAAAATPYKALDPKDPLYPCNTLDAKYQHSCYGMQTSAILFFNGGNVPATARVCDTVPEAHRATCYQSLGRDISANTLQDNTRAMRLCSNGDPLYQPWCHGADAKRACYEAVGEEVAALSADPARKRAWCDLGEADYRSVCSASAGAPADQGAGSR
jgi:hypothetical protein